MKTRKALAVFLLAAMAPLCLAGCGRKEKFEWARLEYTVFLAPPPVDAERLPAAMLDGDDKTFYESKPDEASPGKPVVIILDLGQPMANICRLRYLPRQDGQLAGRVREFRVYAAKPRYNYAGQQFTGEPLELEAMFDLISSGSWDPDSDEARTATFRQTEARYIALQVTPWGVGGGGFSAAELEVWQSPDHVKGVMTAHMDEARAIEDFGREQNLPAIADAAQAWIDLVGYSTDEVAKLSFEEQARLLEELKVRRGMYENAGKLEGLTNGGLWIDTQGRPIQAHGGSILKGGEDGKTYFWYGEDASAENLKNTAFRPATGIRCYASADLVNWEDQGLVLPVFNNPQLADGTPPNNGAPMLIPESAPAYGNSPMRAHITRAAAPLPLNGNSRSPHESVVNMEPALVAACNALYDGLTFGQKSRMYLSFNWAKVISRPQVIYNEANRQYVMWWQQDNMRRDGEASAFAGVAVSDSPTGPFRFVSAGHIPLTDEAGAALNHELRDLALFLDEDKTAWLVFIHQDTNAPYIVKLDESYAAPAVNEDGGSMEGEHWMKLDGEGLSRPVVFRSGRRHFILMQDERGGTVSFVSAKGMLGKWKAQGGIAKKDPWGDTFHSQGSFVLQNGKRLILLTDRAEPYDQKNSAYAWLPLELRFGRPVLKWADSFQQ
ncbi:MAG: discoidin domain-containing protein [Oscillospiraceae bacterium]|nr:discoidin domain-containing protein [Oscillospiraceae bacterium]